MITSATSTSSNVKPRALLSLAHHFLVACSTARQRSTRFIEVDPHGSVFAGELKSPARLDPLARNCDPHRRRTRAEQYLRRLRSTVVEHRESGQRCFPCAFAQQVIPGQQSTLAPDSVTNR